MVRAKTHKTRFAWSDERDKWVEKYMKKCVEGPKGRFWVETIYYGLGTKFYCTMNFSPDFKGDRITLTISELEQQYTIIESLSLKREKRLYND